MPEKNNIRLVFLADTHLGFDYPIRPRVDRRRRGQDFFDNFQRVLSFAIDKKVDMVIHGGDFFFRSRIPPKIVDMAYQLLFEFADMGIPIFIVPGNHERSKLPESLFLSHPNIYIFHKPQTYSMVISETSVCIAGFPSERDNIRYRFTSTVEKTRLNTHSADIKLLCLHQAVEGARVGPSNYTFQNGQDVIRKQDLPAECLAILCGHIHRKQILMHYPDQNPKGIPVIYPGSTERTSFAEKSEEKGFFDIKFSYSDEKKWKIQSQNFRLLPTRPMVDLYLEGHIKIENLKPYLLSKLSGINSDAIVRLKCNGELDEKIKIMLTSRFLRENFLATLNFQLSSDFYSFRRASRFK